MDVKVIRFDSAYNGRLEKGTIRLYLADGSTHDFAEVAAVQFSVLLAILASGNAYWNSNDKWLFTNKELTLSQPPAVE